MTHAYNFGSFRAITFKEQTTKIAYIVSTSSRDRDYMIDFNIYFTTTYPT